MREKSLSKSVIKNGLRKNRVMDIFIRTVLLLLTIIPNFNGEKKNNEGSERVGKNRTLRR